jgi:hypothetical protein
MRAESQKQKLKAVFLEKASLTPENNDTQHGISKQSGDYSGDSVGIS